MNLAARMIRFDISGVLVSVISIFILPVIVLVAYQLQQDAN
jgi:hypothetical protein